MDIILKKAISSLSVEDEAELNNYNINIVRLNSGIVSINYMGAIFPMNPADTIVEEALKEVSNIMSNFSNLQDSFKNIKNNFKK